MYASTGVDEADILFGGMGFDTRIPRAFDTETQRLMLACILSLPLHCSFIRHLQMLHRIWSRKCRLARLAD